MEGWKDGRKESAGARKGGKKKSGKWKAKKARTLKLSPFPFQKGGQVNEKAANKSGVEG